MLSTQRGQNCVLKQVLEYIIFEMVTKSFMPSSSGERARVERHAWCFIYDPYLMLQS